MKTSNYMQTISRAGQSGTLLQTDGGTEKIQAACREAGRVIAANSFGIMQMSSIWEIFGGQFSGKIDITHE